MPGDDRAGRDAPNEQFLGGCRLLSYAFTEKQEVLHQMVRELNQPHQPKEPIVNQPPRAPARRAAGSPGGAAERPPVPILPGGIDRKSRRVGLGMTVESHIPGALSIPLDELRARLGELPAGQEVVAYCRGPYCVLAPQAVKLLAAQGIRARRLTDGLPEWRLAGHPVAVGAKER